MWQHQHYDSNRVLEVEKVHSTSDATSAATFSAFLFATQRLCYIAVDFGELWWWRGAWDNLIW